MKYLEGGSLEPSHNMEKAFRFEGAKSAQQFEMAPRENIHAVARQNCPKCRLAGRPVEESIRSVYCDLSVRLSALTKALAV